MTKIETAELLALKEQIAPGPWLLAGDDGSSVVDSTGYEIAWDMLPNDARAIAHLPDLMDEVLASRALLEQAEAVLEPFSEMAGEMFARNWNKDSVAISFVGVDGPIRLTFAEFMGARSTLAALRQHREASHG